MAASKKTIKQAIPLYNEYMEKIIPALKKELNYKSVMQVPKLEKIVINMGLGKAIQNKNLITEAVDELSLIVGQKPVITHAKKSIANFKLREGMPIGVKVTLRGERMYSFLEKLISIALPRVRDFRGVSKHAFDGFGNYTMGIKEHLIFPEIEFDKVKNMKGMDITIVTSAKSDSDALALLKHFKLPFVRENN